VVGHFNNANPIFAVNDVDTSISKLIFSSLITYDDNNQLVGNLAKSWSADERGISYTVKLKKNLFWQDGKNLTADDVVFTYQTIQNPDVKSPYFTSWSNIKITKVDSQTIKFVLPNAYSPFPHYLTGGIIPKHLLKDVPPAELRSHSFNNKEPVGSGPFKLTKVDVNNDEKADLSSTIQMVSNSKYHLGQVKLDGINIKTYRNNGALIEANSKHQVMTAAGLPLSDKQIISGHDSYSFNLMSANMIFLKTNSPVLASTNVRKALQVGTNSAKLISKIDYPVIPVKGPILNSQIGYNPDLMQPAFNKAQAVKLLEEAGWTLSGNAKYRSNNNKPLILKMTYQDSPDFSKIADELQKQWKELGVNLSIEITPDDQVNRRILDSHDYDVLLYGINIGADPDVYAYWHSSQIDKKLAIHLNLSEYKSAVADSGLEAGRSRQDPTIRATKYKPFIEAWKKDAPAIGLYQPRYLYVYSHQVLYGINAKYINTPSDRFNNVQDWMIKTARETKR
jgi:peptide/nickel transport system substrate-binding protein